MVDPNKGVRKASIYNPDSGFDSSSGSSSSGYISVHLPLGDLLGTERVSISFKFWFFYCFKDQ